LEKTLLEIYLLSSAIIGTLVAMYLFLDRSKHDNQYLSNLLGIIILCSSSHFLRNYLISSGWILNFPWYYGTFSFIYVLAPQITYLYARGLLKDESRFNRRDSWQLLPAFIQICLSIPYILSSRETKLGYVRELTGSNNFLNNTPFNGVPNGYYFMVVFSGIVIYSILILKEIKNAELNQKDPFQLEIYQWARFTFIASFAMAIFMIINVIVKSTGSNANFYLTAFGPFLWLRLLLFTIILIRVVFYKRLLWGLPNFKRVSLSISKQLVAVPNTELIDAELSNTEEDGQSERILLNESQAKQYQLVLSQFFQSQTHIYTELEFNLNHLAHHTKIPKHHWAYYFQYHSEMSFVELRNKNRIEFSKNIMRLPAFRNRTIEAIGNASGFGSRVTYFNAFRKYESITPSEYWESLKKDSTENAPELN
jgi:AraC-like DNA-binding protein